MNPIAEAQRITLAGGATVEQWAAALRGYLVAGYVVSTPDAFLMVRPVRHDASLGDMIDPLHRFDTPDCWFVHTASGVLESIMLHLPFWLPLVAFQRSDARRPGCTRLRFYRLDRLRHLALIQPAFIHHG